MQDNYTGDAQQLELFYTKNFSYKEIEELCFDIAQTLLEKYFLSNILTNATYEKDIFKIIKKLIISDLNNAFENNVEFNVHLSVYIFKKHFKLIFEFLSEFLMQEVAYSNVDVIEFLKYYSLHTLVVDKKKYTVPNIQEDDGPIWNVTTMFGILKVYVKAQNQVDILEEKIQILEAKIRTYYVEGLSPLEHNQTVEKKYLALENKIIQNASYINRIHDSLSLAKNETDRDALNKELDMAQKKRRELRDEKAEITKLKIKQYTMLEYDALTKQQEPLYRDIKPYYKIIEQNKDSYYSIKKALTKALISKKQAI